MALSAQLDWAVYAIGPVVGGGERMSVAAGALTGDRSTGWERAKPNGTCLWPIACLVM